MKIRFLEGEKFNGKVSVIVNEDSTTSAGWYQLYPKEICVVRQKYWYITLFILAHELVHALIDCFFPYTKNNMLFGSFSIDPKHFEDGVLLESIERKYHVLHKILDRYWYLPKRWQKED